MDTNTIPIFDIDTHYAEPPDLWTSRAPARFKDKVLHVRTNANGEEAWYIEDRQVAMIGPSVIGADMKKRLGTATVPTFAAMARAASYPQERLIYMDSYGCGSQIVYPNVIGFGAQQLMRMSSDMSLRQWHVEAYNDALIDMQTQGNGRLLPQAVLPLWDIDASLKELARVRKLGLTGVVMSDKPGDFGQPPLTHPVWEPLFDCCQDLMLPINFHIASGSFFEVDLQRWWSEDRSYYKADGSLNGLLSTFSSVQCFLQNFADIGNLILQGTLDKYPRLKFVSVESGCGWIPFAMQALEYNFREMVSAADRRRFKRTPTEMFIEQIYTSYWFEDRNCIDLYLKQFGNTNLLFETDFPHPTSLYSNVEARVRDTLGHHDRQTQENVLYRNAERVYGIAVHGKTTH
jgi:predicted TIM-barrel fold metal-dependent hydrolase